MDVRPPIRRATGACFAALLLLLAGCAVDAPEAPEPPVGDEPSAYPLEASVAALAFGTVDHPEVSEQAVSVTNRSTRAVEVAGSLEDLSEEFELVDWPEGGLELPAGEAVELSLRFAPITSATWSGRLVLAAVDADVEVELPVSAVGRAPRLSVEVVGGGELGPLDWRCPAAAQVQLRSTGTLPVELQSIELDPEAGASTLPDGVDGELPLILSPGAYETLVVTWTPSGAVTESVGVAVESSDPIEPTTSVEIIGTATAAPVSTVSTVVEPRADLILAQSDIAGSNCGGGDFEPYDPDYQIPALVDLLTEDEIDFRLVGCTGDGDGAVTDPSSDPDNPQPLVVTASSSIWDLYEVIIQPASQSAPQVVLTSLAAFVTSSGYADTFRRPGARLLVVIFRDGYMA